MNDGLRGYQPPEAAPPAPAAMSLTQVVDVSVRIMRRHWRVLLLVALLLVGPVALLTAATGERLNAVLLDVFPALAEGNFDEAEPLTRSEFDRLTGAAIASQLAATLAGVLSTIAALGFAAVVAADYHGRSTSPRAALGTCLRRALSALGVVLVTTLVVLALIILGIAAIVLTIVVVSGGDVTGGGPGAFLALVIGVGLVLGVIYLSLRWALAVPVLAVEDVGWRTGLARSWHLSGDNVWRTLAISIIGLLAAAILGALISRLMALLLVDLLAASLGLDGTVAETIAVATGTALTAPVGAVMMAVLYFDLRTRRDAPLSAGGSGGSGI